METFLPVSTGDASPYALFGRYGMIPHEMGRVNRTKLRELMQANGISAAALSARATGTNTSLVKDILSGKSRNPRSDSLSAIARELGVTVADLLTDDDTYPDGSATSGRAMRVPKMDESIKRASASKIGSRNGSPPLEHGSWGVHPRLQLRRVPLVGEVRAGAWEEVMVTSTEAHIDIAEIPEYRRASLFALRVVGRSMDRYYPEGTVLICVKVPDADVREGDHVILQRHRAGLVETTVKEVVTDEHGPAFWPRSTDPAHQTPFRMTGDEHADEGAEVIGVVIRHVPAPRPRSGAPVDLSRRS